MMASYLAQRKESFITGRKLDLIRFSQYGVSILTNQKPKPEEVFNYSGFYCLFDAVAKLYGRHFKSIKLDERFGEDTLIMPLEPIR